jgi:hypothetical protein
MPDLAERIRATHAPSAMSDAHVARGWEDVVERLSAAPAPSRAPRHRRVSRRVLIAVVIAVISLASVALAQDRALRELVGLTDAERSAERMEVFTHPPTGTRGMTAEMRDMVGFASVATHSGARGIDPRDLRLAMTYRSDPYLARLWTAPSRTGEACLFVEMPERGGSGSCSYGMKYNGHVTVGTWHDIRMGSFVTGMADDEVSAVHVRLSKGRQVTARLANNVFAVRIGNPNLRTRGLVVTLTDGRTIDVAMNGCLRSQMSRPLTSRLGCGYGMNRGPADVRLG